MGRWLARPGTRIVRRLGLDRNGMRPVSDRIERWLAAVLLVAFVVAAPPLAGWAARSVYRGELRQLNWDRQHLRRVTGGGSAGDRVTIWVDERGEQAQPLSGATPGGDAAAAATGTVLALASALAAVRWTVRRLVARHRLRLWQAEWREVGPRWTRRR